MNSTVLTMPVITLLSATILATTSCGTSEGSSTDADTAAPTGARVIAVEVVAVRRSDFRDVLRVTGEVEALEDVLVSAQEGGVVERFVVEKGASVRRGDSLAVLDASVLRAQVEEARAAARLAHEQHDRQRILWEDERVGTEVAYLQSKYGAEIADARLATLEARLARTVIRAPVDGVFDERYVDQGEMALPGIPVARVVGLDQVKVVAGVPERYAAAVHRGDAAQVTFDVFPERELSGRIAFVGSVVDEDNRTFPIEVVLANRGRVIKPRMVANVAVVRAQLRGVVVVPQQVVLRTGTGYEVFVVAERDGETVATARPVRLGPSHDNLVVIEEGLEPDEYLIVVGHQLVSDGALVRVIAAQEER
jgi:RND family efflux transporter MFP subunit